MRIIRFTYLLFFLVSSACILSVEVPINDFPLLGILSFAILPALVINLIYLIYFIIRKHYKFLAFSLIFIAFSFKHYDRTFNFYNQQSKGEIKVLNSNVRIFNVYKHLRSENNESSKKMIDWLKTNEADILILQEYYNDHRANDRVWSSTYKISKYYPYNYFKVALTVKGDYDFGQIIFSKHPIINSGFIKYENRTFNQTTFADIKINNDTIRVYNVHLQSMAIEERVIFDGRNNEKQVKNKLKDTSNKLLRGIRLRTKQVEKIVTHIKNSPYPVILGSDMNDIPYGKSYDEFCKILNNSFDKKGTCFGFTFNGKTLLPPYRQLIYL